MPGVFDKVSQVLIQIDKVDDGTNQLTSIQNYHIYDLSEGKLKGFYSLLRSRARKIANFTLELMEIIVE